MNDENRQSGSDFLLPIILVIFLTLLGGGGFLFYSMQRRVEMQRVEAMMAREQAMRAKQAVIAAQLAAEGERLQRESVNRDTTVYDATSEETEVIIHIDQNGALTIGGESVDLDALQMRLTASQEQYVIEASRDCSFAHIADLIALFEKNDREQPTLVAE